ncbi:MAG: hypothetical protein HYW50_01795, partial [Candidatus Diapherotrites archaeon]|nr:hypothetical protein [Candidatus Diapherotrites archaeon]
MSFSLLLPRINSKSNSTKEKIVSVLAIKWPLSVKETYSSLKNDFGFLGSYQAVHKVVTELVQEGVVEKTVNGFQLDKHWIGNLNTFTKNLKKSYEQNNFQQSDPSGIVHLQFKSFIEYTKFLIHDFFGDESLNPQKKEAGCFWAHVYPAIGIGNVEHETMKKIMNYTTHYAVCRNNTIADTFFNDYFEKLGKKCITGVDFSVKNDTFVHGDYVLEGIFSPEITAQWDELFEKIDELDNLNLQKLFDFTTDKNKIDVIIFKNKEFAQNLVKEAKKIYENKKKDKIELNSLHESDMFLLDFILQHLPANKETMAWQWSHYWIPLFLSKKEYQKISKINDKFEVYSAVKGNTAIDKWCSEFWNQNGAKTVFGKNFSSGTDTVAFSEFVIQVHYPQELMKKLEDFFNKAKTIQEINVNQLFQTIFLEKTKIIVVVNKNKELAERIKEET